MVSAGGNRGDEVLEETEGGGSNRDGTLGLPDGNGIVELLSGGEGEEVPGVAIVVDVFNVATNSHGGSLRDAVVDGPRTEGISDGLVVGEGLVRARLERGGVTAEAGIVRVDGGENAVAVLSRATSIVVD